MAGDEALLRIERFFKTQATRCNQWKLQKMQKFVRQIQQKSYEFAIIIPFLGNKLRVTAKQPKQWAKLFTQDFKVKEAIGQLLLKKLLLYWIFDEIVQRQIEQQELYAALKKYQPLYYIQSKLFLLFFEAVISEIYDIQYFEQDLDRIHPKTKQILQGCINIMQRQAEQDYIRFLHLKLQIIEKKKKQIDQKLLFLESIILVLKYHSVQKFQVQIINDTNNNQARVKIITNFQIFEFENQITFKYLIHTLSFSQIDRVQLDVPSERQEFDLHNKINRLLRRMGIERQDEDYEKKFYIQQHNCGLNLQLNQKTNYQIYNMITSFQNIISNQQISQQQRKRAFSFYRLLEQLFPTNKIILSCSLSNQYHFNDIEMENTEIPEAPDVPLEELTSLWNPFPTQQSRLSQYDSLISKSQERNNRLQLLSAQSSLNINEKSSQSQPLRQGESESEGSRQKIQYSSFNDQICCTHCQIAINQGINNLQSDSKQDEEEKLLIQIQVITMKDSSLG